MASEVRHMECLLGIDTKSGWEKSVTKVLSSFEDLSFDIDPSMGLAYVRGKMDPHTVLKKLKKGGKHAMIHWVTYGPKRDEDHHQYQPRQPYNLSLLHAHPYNDPYAYDPYNNHNLYGNYNPWHANNMYNPHLLNNINVHHQQYLDHPALSQPRQRRSSVHLHQHGSPEPSSSDSTLSPSRPVRGPLVFDQPPASSVGLGFTKKVFSIKEVIGKFRSCLGCVPKINKYINN